MSQKNIALAYCIDNIHTAEEIDQNLSQSGYRFEHYYGKKTTSEPSLNEQMSAHEGPILLMISDNFLKSAQCMNQSLDLIQEKGDLIIPIISPGTKRNEESGDLMKVETNFERVSDIIQYINYWQDQYLDLRRQKRQLREELNEEELSLHLKVMREISSEAGEFLRLLRNMDYVTLNEFQDHHYKAFFEILDNLDDWDHFKEVPLVKSSPFPEEQDNSKDELPPESREIPTPPPPIVNEEEPNEEEIEIDLEDIPGISLLEGKENISKIIEQKKQDPIESPEPTTEEEENASEENPVDENLLEEEEDQESIVSKEEESNLIDLTLPSEEEEEEEKEEEEYLVNLEVRNILTQAMNLMDQGQFKESLQLLKEKIEVYPAHDELRYRYALLLAQDGSEIEEAMENLQITLKNDPENDDANFLMGELEEMKGDYTQAVHYYQEVASNNPDYLDVFYRLGIVFSKYFENSTKQAAKYFKKAIKKNPANVDAVYQYALLLGEKLEKPKKAIKYFKRTLLEQADHPFANYDLALLYHQLNKKEEAWQAYQDAIKVNPELQTAENDLVFSHSEPEPEPEPVLEPVASELVGVDNSSELAEQFVEEEFSELNGQPDENQENVVVMEQDTIEALKANIRRLEEILMTQTEQRVLSRKPQDVSVKTVFISGATSGIGKATAEIFASHGHRLILNGRRIARLEALKNQFESEFESDILLLPFDVRDTNSIKASIDSLPEEWQNIDILFNNAGKAKGFSPIHEGQLDHWEEMIDTNIKGLLYLTRAVAPFMARRKSGHIINVSSIAGKEVYPNGNVYCATKFAVEALTKAMRIDLHKFNIRVSQVAPGHVEETEFALVRFDGNSDKAKIYEEFRPLTSKDVAETVYFIATRPTHVNVQDVLMMGTQQASATLINKSGREG